VLIIGLQYSIIKNMATYLPVAMFSILLCVFLRNDAVFLVVRVAKGISAAHRLPPSCSENILGTAKHSAFRIGNESRPAHSLDVFGGASGAGGGQGASGP
jgi:hypothetical protein